MTHAHLSTGIHSGITPEAYHADPCEVPSLSSSVARTLLYQSPKHAWLEHARLGKQRREATAAMNTGSIVHAILAGQSDQIEVGYGIEHYRTNAAKEWRDNVRALGRIPVLEKDMLEPEAIARAVIENCAPGFDNDPFRATRNEGIKRELVAVWPEEGALCRALVDCVDLTRRGELDLWDWKVTADVSDRAIQRSIADRGYVFQLAFYLRGLRALMPEHASKISACLVFVESQAPHTVRRVYPSAEYMHHADGEVHKAIALWAKCCADGLYNDPRNGAEMTVDLPGWLIDEAEITIE